jgi:hypothetical protein
MVTLDAVLSWAIPIGAIIFIGAALFGKIKEPIYILFTWIKDLLGLGISRIKETEVPPRPTLDGSIVYR